MCYLESGRWRLLMHVVLGAVLALSAVTLTGCASNRAQHAAVDAYVRALPDALSARSLTPLRSAASTREVERVRLYVMQLVGEHRRLGATLIELRYVADEPRGATRYDVTTNEYWRTTTIDQDSAPATEERLEVTYHLVRVDSRWMVDSVEKRVAR